MKVLVVDSDLQHLQALLAALRQRGYEPLGASSYEEGKQLWVAEKPPMLIADVRLGQFNGLQLLLRARADRPDVTAIITCPFPDKMLEAETRRFGGTFLVKPLKPEDVLATVLDRQPLRPMAQAEWTLVERRTADRRTTIIPNFTPDRRLSDRRQPLPPAQPAKTDIRN